MQIEESTETTTRILPVMFTACFVAQDHYTGRLALQPTASHTLYITVVHDSMVGTASYELHGNASPLEIAVHDDDALVILCRYEGDIIASAVCQVAFRLIEQIDALLDPLSLCNVILDQHSKPAPTDDLVKAARVTPTTGEIEAILADVNGLVEVRA